jgi:hypothetical protein
MTPLVSGQRDMKYVNLKTAKVDGLVPSVKRRREKKEAGGWGVASSRLVLLVLLFCLFCDFGDHRILHLRLT